MELSSTRFSRGAERSLEKPIVSVLRNEVLGVASGSNVGGLATGHILVVWKTVLEGS